ncbi:MAG: hypothetical protein Q8S33_06350 [Myxococcales bacterium]|nr:hypothetical protein [Myxococcales bacterium]
MNARNRLPTVARHSLEALLVEGRMPLDAALQLSHALVRAIEDHHATGQAIGPFDTGSIAVDVLGHVVIKPSLRPEAAAPELGVGGVADLLSDLHSLGGVLYRLFAGLSHQDAAKRSGGSLVPPSRFNPTIDDALDGLVLTLLDPDPIERPYRLAQVDGQLLAIFAELGLEPSPQAVSSWVASHRPAAPVATAAPIQLTAPVPLAKLSAPRRTPPPVKWALDAEDEADVADESFDPAWEGPVRFDLWAAASAGVVALGLSLIALM